MANDTRSARLAVLIDADNASPKIVDRLFEEVARLGEASVRRIYGDFSSVHLRGWMDVLPKYAIIPQHQTAHTVGKNSSDITMVIDAMDLVHAGNLEGVCLISSDSDFTRLASRIREGGLLVYGFGKENTAESFRQACHRFFYTESFVKTPAPAGQQSDQPVSLIRRAINDLAEDENQSVMLGRLANQIYKIKPDFSYPGKLITYIRTMPEFKVEIGKDGHPLVSIARKPAKKQATARKPS